MASNHSVQMERKWDWPHIAKCFGSKKIIKRGGNRFAGGPIET